MAFAATRGSSAPFQSAPVVTDGRCLERQAGGVGVLQVSIRARRHRRAMRTGRLSSSPNFQFQSAPVVTDGRCPRRTPTTCRPRRFNPRPSSPTGDAAGSRLRRRGGCCFNPRPSSPTGDAVELRRVELNDLVSIRARRHRRAMRWRPPGVELQSVVSIRARRHRRAMRYGIGIFPSVATFQSAPVVTDGRCWLFVVVPPRFSPFQSAPVVTDGRCRPSSRIFTSPGVFQSAPVVTDGRCGRAHTLPGLRGRFNPRPSSPTGDARGGAPGIHADGVSIRARRHRRAMRAIIYDDSATNKFQSAPVVTDGRCVPYLGQGGLPASFQSAPVVTDGRCPGDAPGGRRTNRFNPRPSSPTGDATIASRLAHSTTPFQSAPVVTDGRCPCRARRRSPAVRVSIRARRHRRAMRADAPP